MSSDREIIAWILGILLIYFAIKTAYADTKRNAAKRTEIEKTRRTETINGEDFTVVTIPKTIIKNRKTGREAVVIRKGRETELSKPRWIQIQYINKKTQEAKGIYQWASMDNWDVVETINVNEYKKI